MGSLSNYAHVLVPRLLTAFLHLLKLYLTKRNETVVCEAILICKTTRKWDNHLIRSRIDEMNPRGNFQVAFPLCFKARPSAKPFMWKLIIFTLKLWFIYMWTKLISTSKTTHNDLLWNRGERQLSAATAIARTTGGLAWKIRWTQICRLLPPQINRK